jgi:hypothetical protein
MIEFIDIFLCHLSQSQSITGTQSSANFSSLTAEDSLHSCSNSTTDYGRSIENTSVVQHWLCVNYIENTPSVIGVFTARCIATEIILLLLAYSLPCIFVGLT